MNDIVLREIAARLQRIEDAFTDLPDKLRTIRRRYEVSADSLRLLKAMIAMLPDSPARNRLIAAAEITVSNLYTLADVLSTLVGLELACSDYRVLVGLLRDDLEEGVEPTLVSVYPIGEKIA